METQSTPTAPWKAPASWHARWHSSLVSIFSPLAKDLRQTRHLFLSGCSSVSSPLFPPACLPAAAAGVAPKDILLFTTRPPVIRPRAKVIIIEKQTTRDLEMAIIIIMVEFLVVAGSLVVRFSKIMGLIA